MLEKAKDEKAMKEINSMGGFPGMGGMGMPGMGGMGGPGGKDEGPFSAAALEKLKDHPKVGKYFEDVQFKNMFEMVKQNPQMLMQVMQMDPRFMEVFQVLTGIDLEAMGAAAAKRDEEDAATKKKNEEERKKREEEEAEKAKKAAEEALPDSEKNKL